MSGAEIAFLVVSAAASVASAVESRSASKQQAKLLQEQGDLQLLEAQEEADRLKEETRKNKAKQQLAFLKSGVTLAGSPSLVLQETLDEGDDFVNSVLRRGNADRNKSKAQAGVATSEGRAALIGGIGTAAGTASGIFK